MFSNFEHFSLTVLIYICWFSGLVFTKCLFKGYSSLKSIDFLLNPFCIKLITIHLSACNFATCIVFIQRTKFKPKCLSEKQTGKTLIILLLQKQSDLGLGCLSRLFDRQQVLGILEHLP